MFSIIIRIQKNKKKKNRVAIKRMHSGGKVRFMIASFTERKHFLIFNDK